MNDDQILARLDAEEARLVAARVAVGRERVELQAEPATDALADGSLLEREVDESLLASLDEELRAIEAARTRVAAGTYGACEACGAMIAEERLAAVPATRFCVDHERRAETLLEGRASDEESPRSAAELSGREAARHLDLVPDDDSVVDEQDDWVGPEDAAVHLRP